MRLLILSDLHMEFLDASAFAPWPVDPNSYDAVVLAGDIHTGASAVKWAEAAFSKDVFFVPGNHEYYGSVLSRGALAMRNAADSSPNVILLDNDSIDFMGFRIIGSTLWTDFNLYGEDKDTVDAAMAITQGGIADYRKIRMTDAEWLLPSDTKDLFAAASAFLDGELDRAKRDGMPAFVITHHLPSMRSVALKYGRADPLNAAFASNADFLVQRAVGWVHGHTHTSLDYMIGGCRVVCNPGGYPKSVWSIVGGRENTDFNPGKIIEVPPEFLSGMAVPGHFAKPHGV